MKRNLSAIALIFSLTLLSSVSFALYTPQEALTDALSEPLTFVGYYMPKYSESQKYPNCLFKNSKVLLMSSYCVRQNVPAGSVKFHATDPSKGYVRIYTEIQNPNKDISTAKRADYLEFILSTSVRITEQAFDPSMSVKAYEKWEDIENKNYTKYCVTGQSFKDQPYSTACADITNELHVWGPHGFKFWQKSDPKWPKLLKALKSQIRNLPNYPY
ncbi:MAG: hypothetical protein V4760_11495 [Bdellovibrionota bacterium]